MMNLVDQVNAVEMNEVNNMDKPAFIKTTDKETAEKLTKLGFTLITQFNDEYIFANDSITTFDRNDKVEFSNIMYG